MTIQEQIDNLFDEHCKQICQQEAEKYFGRKADKNRKIYNGMLKTYFYQFLGPKPPRPKK